MAHWRDTPEAIDFIATADSRETSPKIMEAIAYFARNKHEAESLWNGEGFGTICSTTDFWEQVTGNGQRDPSEFCWGSSGSHWWPMDDLERR